MGPSDLTRHAPGASVGREPSPQRAVILGLAEDLASDGARATVERATAHLSGLGYEVSVVSERRLGALRKESRRAARSGVQALLVVGGELTLDAAARGLAASDTVLGVLGIGEERLPLLGSPVARPLGEVTAKGRRRPRPFLECASVEGAVEAGGTFLPVEMDVSLGGTPFWHGLAIAVEVRNLAVAGETPAHAPLEVRIVTAPGADGRSAGHEGACVTATGQRIDVRAATRLPVRVAGKTIGRTPAAFTVRSRGVRLAEASGAAPRVLVRRPVNTAASVPVAGAEVAPARAPLMPITSGTIVAPLPLGSAAVTRGGGLVGQLRPSRPSRPSRLAGVLRRLGPALIPLTAAAGGVILGAVAGPLLQRLRRRADRRSST